MADVISKAPMLKDEQSFSHHDLSHYFGFKFAPGHACPVFSQFMNPNERIKLRVNSFIRLQPMVTPAFLDLECHIDYFFVPMEMLMMVFGRNFSRTREFFSSFISLNGRSINTSLPLFNGCLYSNQSIVDEIKRYQSLDGSSHDLVSLNVDSDGYVVGDNSVPSWFDNANLVRPAFESIGNRMIRLFDFLGLELPSVYSKILTGDLYSADFGIQSTSGNMVKSRLGIYSSYGFGFQNHFPYKILAYNAIWENYYRLDDFIQYENKTFNIDRLSDSSGAFSAHQFNDFSGSGFNIVQNEWPCIKYVPKKLDYFTSSVNNPVVQNLNINGVSTGSNNLFPANKSYLEDDEQLLFTDYNVHNENVSFGSNTSSVNVFGDTIYDGDSISLSMARLRLVKAQEKMLQIYGRLPKKNYDTFVYALFGQKIPHDVKHELSHLGHDSFKINIGQITQSATTSEAPLGEYAGTGAGSSKSKGIKFTAPCHGVVMAIQYVKPEYMYSGGFLRENYINSFNDFYLPPYDNLGRQPLYQWELSSSASNNRILGWQFRYQQFKSKINRVTRAFQYGTERSWFLTQDFNDVMSAIQGTNQLSVSYRYVNPNCLNDIMVVRFQPFYRLDMPREDYDETFDNVVNYFRSPWLVYSTDPFICIDKIDCSLFSKMSTYSLQTID